MPTLIVMDEPSAILAGHELEQLFATIRSLKAQGVTIIYISHRLNEIFEIADEVTVLKDGAVVGTAPVSECDPAGADPDDGGAAAGGDLPEGRAAAGRGGAGGRGAVGHSGQAGTWRCAT